MSVDEKEIEKPNETLNIIEKLNNKNQQGQGLKILTPDQMLRRLPICLAQLKAENDLEKNLKWNKTTIVFFILFKKVNQNNL